MPAPASATNRLPPKRQKLSTGYLDKAYPVLIIITIITIYADGKSIEDLIPNYLRKKQDKSRLWQRTDYKGEPWVKNISRPFTAGKGLEGRHIALCKATENIIKRTRDVGNGNVPDCSVPQKTCSPNHSSYLILYPCWKMREP